jgi:hypothetical protein
MNLEHEEAKARYRAVKNTATVGCNGRKTNRYSNKIVKTRNGIFRKTFHLRNMQ